MSYQCKLKVQTFEKVNRKWVSREDEQVSPLIFSTLPERAGFATKMFTPPDTVASYEIVNTHEKPNAALRKGIVRIV